MSNLKGFFVKGNKWSFQKGHISGVGETHPGWKGEEVKHSGCHLYIRNNYGNPKKCEDCGKVGQKVGRNWNIDWSNCDHKYKRIREDYKGRCRSCHQKYDIKNGLRRPNQFSEKIIIK